MVEKIMMWVNNPLVWSGFCLLAGILFTRKAVMSKYKKWMAIAYILINCIEKFDNPKIKRLVETTIPKDLKKELDDVLVILGYRGMTGETEGLKEVEREHFEKAFPELSRDKRFKDFGLK